MRAYLRARRHSFARIFARKTWAFCAQICAQDISKIRVFGRSGPDFSTGCGNLFLFGRGTFLKIVRLSARCRTLRSETRPGRSAATRGCVHDRSQGSILGLRIAQHLGKVRGIGNGWNKQPFYFDSIRCGTLNRKPMPQRPEGQCHHSEYIRGFLVTLFRSIPLVVPQRCAPHQDLHLGVNVANDSNKL